MAELQDENRLLSEGVDTESVDLGTADLSMAETVLSSEALEVLGGIGVVGISQQSSDEDDGQNVISFEMSSGAVFNITIKNGSKGSQGKQGIQGPTGSAGYSIVANVVRGNEYPESTWQNYGITGKLVSWSNTSDKRCGCRENDVFTVTGRASDTRNAHLLFFRSTTAWGDLCGVCIGHTFVESGYYERDSIMIGDTILDEDTLKRLIALANAKQ